MVGQVFVFVYSKNKQIKVLGLEKDRESKETLIKEGWKHIHTIDVCVWMEYLHNNCDDIDVIDEVKSLSRVIIKTK